MQFLLHLFFCPRAELVLNDCYFCLMILIDDTEASLEFVKTTEYFFRLIFARSVFPSDLSEKFI